jgi:hypothetical protein
MNEAMQIFDSSMQPVARKALKRRNDDEKANIYQLQKYIRGVQESQS